MKILKAAKFITILLIASTLFLSLGNFHGGVKSGRTSVNFDEVTQASKPLFDIFNKKKKTIKSTKKLYLGGMMIGFSLKPEGVIVVGFSDTLTIAKDCGLNIGDLLISIDGEYVDGVADIDRIINKPENADRELTVIVVRGNKEKELKIKPAFDENAGYKFGIWVKDSAAGLGTVTYITEDGRFGALGHPVADHESKLIINPKKDGTCYRCEISGFNKGVKGKPGALKGFFLKSKNIIGTVEINNNFGIFGRFNEYLVNDKETGLMPVCPRSEVKEGKAKIYSTIGDTIEAYDIEIVRAYTQKTPRDKGMVIKVTDLRLLNKTGGIIQGMSGSPIVQNGYIVGAITHVFVNDPTRGYGMYVEFMMEESDKLEQNLDSEFSKIIQQDIA